MADTHGNNTIYFYVVPGGMYLFSLDTLYIPRQGELVDFDGVSYSVQDIIYDAVMIDSAVDPEVPDATLANVRVKVEIQVVP